MSYMIELYSFPADIRKETKLTSRVGKLGGRLDFRETPSTISNTP